MFIFFFKQKTAYEMRISDWSSDVCSSDLCEFLWAGGYKENASPLIRDRNEGDPGWVGRLAESRAAGRRWVLPPRMLTWRLHNLRGICAARMLTRAPFSIAATILSLWPAYQANKRLKKSDAAGFWERPSRGPAGRERGVKGEWVAVRVVCGGRACLNKQ